MMNRRLLMLSGLAILAVVANHTSASGFIAMFWWTDRYLPVAVPNYDQMGSLQYYGLVAQQKLALFSVPSFLFITGMFLAYAARGSQTSLTWGLIRRRILNLLPPYLIWSVVFLAVEYILGTQRNPVEYLRSIFSISHSEFFYVPLIMVYYLLSPVVAPIAKNRPRLLLIISAVMMLAGTTVGYAHIYGKAILDTDPFVNLPSITLIEHQVFEYFFYYALGLVVGFHQSKFREFIAKYAWWFLSLTVIFGVLAVVEAEWVFQNTELISWRSRTLTLPTIIYAISFICTFLAFENVRLPGFLHQLGLDTLGIYLIHQTVLLVAPKIIYHVLPFVLGIQAIYQPLLIAIAVGVPLLLMWLTRKLPVRKYYRLIFG